MHSYARMRHRFKQKNRTTIEVRKIQEPVLHGGCLLPFFCVQWSNASIAPEKNRPDKGQNIQQGLQSKRRVRLPVF